MNARARKDLRSAKKLLEPGNEDIGNAIFLMEQSYEKILKVVYVHIKTRILKQDHLEAIRDIERRHEDGILAIIEILPIILESYNKSLDMLYERVSSAFLEEGMGLDGLVFCKLGLDMMPTPTMKKRLMQKFHQYSDKATVALRPKTPAAETYQEWRELCQAIREQKFSLSNVEAVFNIAYAKYDQRLNIFENKNKLEADVKKAVMFLTLSVILAPLSLAYKFSRYATSNSGFRNLLELEGHSTSMIKGLFVIQEMIQQMIDSHESFMKLAGDYKISERSMNKWKRRRERINQKY